MDNIILKYNKLKLKNDIKTQMLIEIASIICPQKNTNSLTKKKQQKLETHKNYQTYRNI